MALRKSLCGKLCWRQSAHRSLTADTQISLTLELAEFDLFFLAKQTGFMAARPMSSLVTSKRSLCVSNRKIVFLRFFSQNLSICEGVHVCFRGKKRMTREHGILLQCYNLPQLAAFSHVNHHALLNHQCCGRDMYIIWWNANSNKHPFIKVNDVINNAWL